MDDQAALPLEQALEVYGNMVVRAAFGMVKNRQDAEDIAQEVFLTLVRKAPRFENAAHSVVTESGT